MTPPDSEQLLEFEIRERELQEIYLRLLDDHEKLSTILDSFSVALMYTDARWRVRFMNPQAEQTLGWESRELIDRDALNALHIREAELDLPFNVSACERTLAAGLPYVSESATFRSKSGAPVPVYYSINPTSQHEPSGRVIVFRDLSSKRNAAVALREAKLEAEAARRAERTKAEFLAKMSHELRTPMHAILSFARFGKERAGTVERDKLFDYFDKIDVSARRLMKLFDSLLDFSKLEALTVELRAERLDLRALVATVVGECQSLCEERGLRLRMAPGERVDVVCDESRIMQVVRNLLANAVKFSPVGGSIDVRLERGSDSVRFSVADVGVGVPADELQSIFEKFVQSSRTATGSGGTGLGLAICQEIVALHGGRIWAENNATAGATFTFELPVTTEGGA